VCAELIKVPPAALSAAALQGVIEAFVLREGTDYGHRDYSLEEKCATVRKQLRHGLAHIWFDPESGSTTLRLEE
jgi:uncharacterized protein YheU (UPF0270 family)